MSNEIRNLCFEPQGFLSLRPEPCPHPRACGSAVPRANGGSSQCVSPSHLATTRSRHLFRMVYVAPEIRGRKRTFEQLIPTVQPQREGAMRARSQVAYGAGRLSCAVRSSEVTDGPVATEQIPTGKHSIVPAGPLHLRDLESLTQDFEEVRHIERLGQVLHRSQRAEPLDLRGKDVPADHNDRDLPCALLFLK